MWLNTARIPRGLLFRGNCINTINTHFVVVTTGSAGDLFPFLRIADGLRRRGATVTVVAPTLHEPMVRQAGLAFHGTFADPAVLDNPDLWHPRRGFAVVWEAVRPGLRELLPFVQALPGGQRCVIVAHPLALPEADLCRAIRPGSVVVAAYLAPSNIPTVYDPLFMGPVRMPRWVPHAVRRWLWRRVGASVIDPVALPGMNAARAAHGLAPVSKLLDFMGAAPDLSVTLFPEWFGRRQPDWPQPLLCGDFALYDPNPDAAFSPELDQFLRAGAAPLVFTHGTGNRQAVSYFKHALAASQRLGRRAIFLTPHRDQVPASLPAGVLWQAYLPFKKLLPHAAALIHHGGIGTTAEALRAGVPQLIVPLAYDQFDNGARVAVLGAGLTLRHARLSADSLFEKLHQLHASSSISTRSRAISARMSNAGAFEQLVDAISKTASKTGKI